MEYACTLERFRRDVKRHEMHIIKDDGEYRQVRFKDPDCSAYWFDLTTWPGHLCFSGDCGTYVFQRVRDMFTFFRCNPASSTDINPDYWVQKMESVDRVRGSKEFSGSRFRKLIEATFKQLEDDIGTVPDREYCEHLRLELDDRHWGEDVEGLDAAYTFMAELSAVLPDEAGSRFEIEDLWDYGFNDFTYGFIWCCRAIQWGVLQYDLGGAPAQRTAMHRQQILKGRI